MNKLTKMLTMTEKMAYILWLGVRLAIAISLLLSKKQQINKIVKEGENDILTLRK